MSKILSSIPGNMSKSIAKYDTIVIGSGLAGLTTTYQLLKAGQKVALLEKSEKLGVIPLKLHQVSMVFPQNIKSSH